jgi:GntP family gluconate:H+ symporter
MSVLLTSVFVGVSIVAIIYLTSSLKLKAFIALFIVSLFLAFATLPADRIVATIKEGFGNTMASIGFLIILGAIIGITLDRTGGTLSIARYILSKTGERRSVLAMGITGFITGLPIFCDSGFIILSGLARSFSAKSKIAMPLMATVLATSLYSVHCLIPPHPGALAAAGLFQVNIGYLIVVGTVFAIPGALAAYFWTKWITKGKNYPPARELDVDPQIVTENLPSPFLSIFALSIGVVLALFLLKKKTVESMNSVFGEAIEKAGPILIVTAAGGMFGMVIKATGTGEAMGKLLGGTSIGLVVPFLIAIIMKTAQGSSTVAIITSASFVAPMLSMLGLDSESGRLFAMLSMGAGSMIASHANDSYFWVVSNFSDIDPGTNLRVYSTSTIIMGTVVFACVWVTSLIFL